MRRITLAGDNLARFDTLQALHLRVIIQHPDAVAPQWPSVGSNGLVRWPDGTHRPQLRKYTVRSLDRAAGTMDIDFVIHADAGPGSAWAARARVGEQVGVVGPGGGGLKPADWYLFAGDETALPAIGRMLEALPDTARGVALIEVADAAEEQALRLPAGVSVRWLHRDGRAAGTTTLLYDAVRETAFPQDGSTVYAWAACEFEAFRAIRTFLRKEKGLGKAEQLVVSYWRRGKSEDEAEASHD
jgi:NADPH-dependent ferric siderophore reductase